MEEISYINQVKIVELDVLDNWKGDPRERFVRLFDPLIKNSDYFFVMNTTDSTGKLLELHKKGEKRRVLVFKGKQDMTIGAAFNRDFYQFVNNKYSLPENRRPNKTQPHVELSLKSLWNVICAATEKIQYIER